MATDGDARRRTHAHRPPTASAPVAAALASCLALGACGVVHDRIETEPAPLARLEADVKRALAEAGGVDAAALLVSATPEAVTLEGFVADEAERAAMLAAARAAAPGREIVDAMRVHP